MLPGGKTPKSFNPGGSQITQTNESNCQDLNCFNPVPILDVWWRLTVRPSDHIGMNAYLKPQVAALATQSPMEVPASS